MKVEVSSAVLMSVRSYFCAVSSTLGHRLYVVAEYDGADVEAHEALERLAALLGVQALEEGVLDAAYELEPLGVEIVVESGELQRGAVHVRGAHAHTVKVLCGVQYGQALFDCYGAQADGVFVVSHVASFRRLGARRSYIYCNHLGRFWQLVLFPGGWRG